jgi:hypothetical protein
VATLFTPPGRYDLPVSRGGDLNVTFRQQVAGVDTNFASNVTVTFYIDNRISSGVDTISSVASISGSTASVFVAASTMDGVANDSPWRCVMTTPGSRTINQVICNGRVARYDD